MLISLHEQNFDKWNIDPATECEVIQDKEKAIVDVPLLFGTEHIEYTSPASL